MNIRITRCLVATALAATLVVASDTASAQRGFPPRGNSGVRRPVAPTSRQFSRAPVVQNRYVPGRPSIPRGQAPKVNVPPTDWRHVNGDYKPKPPRPKEIQTQSRTSRSFGLYGVPHSSRGQAPKADASPSDWRNYIAKNYKPKPRPKANQTQTRPARSFGLYGVPHSSRGQAPKADASPSDWRNYIAKNYKPKPRPKETQTQSRPSRSIGLYGVPHSSRGQAPKADASPSDWRNYIAKNYKPKPRPKETQTSATKPPPTVPTPPPTKELKPFKVKKLTTRPRPTSASYRQSSSQILFPPDFGSRNIVRVPPPRR